MSVSGQDNSWRLEQSPKTAPGPVQGFLRMLPEIARQAVEAGGILVAVLLPLSFNPLSQTAFQPVKVTLLWLITGLMAGLTLIAWLLEPQRKPIFVQIEGLYRRLGPSLSLSLIVAATALLLSTAASMNGSLSLWGSLDGQPGTATLLLGMLFFLLLANGLRTRTQVNRLLKAIQIGSVPVVIYGLVQAVGLDPLAWLTDSVSPVHATMGRSNFLGAYLAVVIPFSLLGMTLSPRGNQRRRYVILLILQVLCLAATLARGAWLGFSVGIVGYLGLLGFRWQSRRLWATAGLLLVATALVFLLMNLGNPFDSPSPTSPDMQTAYTTLREESASRRFVIWNNTARLAAERWLLGYGPATFESVFSSRYPPGTLYDGTDQVIDDPHNLLLYHWMSGGLLGLLAWIGVLVSIYVALWRSLLRSSDGRDMATVAGLLAAITAYLLQAQLNPQVITLLALFWMVLALSIAQANLATQESVPQTGKICSRTRARSR